MAVDYVHTCMYMYMLHSVYVPGDLLTLEAASQPNVVALIVYC